ncbi:probable E3 ubiquitin-protein ligase HERC4 isoform X2 [Lepisosteus oculatus]|uniref:probable E3 ubiquitin-protein ligase HERC4 isoform X2 n=1 Tax=Lepisosteus oculatus TaxID=7918 RepID=UPI0035F507FB
MLVNSRFYLQTGFGYKFPQKSGTPVWISKASEAVMFSWGSASCQELGLTGRVGIDNAERNDSSPVFLRNRVVEIGCGNGVFGFIKESGNISVFLDGDGEGRQQKRRSRGEVFSWETKQTAQYKDKGPSIQHLKSLLGIPVAQIAAGGDHSFALSLFGTVFGWGRNSAGQLGLGDTQDRRIPTPVTALELKKTVFISCGEEHTAVLTKDGLVFTFGSGSYGQLGHNSLRNELRPRLVAELWGKKVSQIACGRNHTMAYVSSCQKVYSFGCGAQGQLGTGFIEKQLIPLPATTAAAENGTELEVDRIFAGGNQSFVLCSSPKVSGNTPVSQNIATLNNTEVEELISKSRSKKINKINFVFGSSSCLNGSFLKQRKDEHYRISHNTPKTGIDFRQTFHVFQKLKNSEIINQVVAVVCEKLLPSLTEAPAGVEAFRVYVIVPELLRHLDTEQNSKVADSLTVAVLRLNSDSLDVLESLWTDIPRESLKCLVRLYKHQTEECLKQNDCQLHQVKDRLYNLLQMLQILYKSNKKAKKSIAAKMFYLNETFLFLPPYESLHKWEFYPSDADRTRIEQLTDLFCKFHFVLSLPVKVNLFYTNSHLKKLSYWVIFPNEAQALNLAVRRCNLIEDAFKILSNVAVEDLRKLLTVEFVGEIDRPGVLRKDFFLYFFDKVIEPESNMFWYNELSTLLWFPSKTSVEKKKYYLFGILCGLAMNNYNTVHLPFPLALFKKLVDVKPTLEDLKELEPRVGKSLQNVLDYSDDDIEENLCLSFNVSWDGMVVNLHPDGEDIPVTNTNKEQFVSAYVDYVFNKSVKNLFEEFKRGFYQVCKMDMVKIFQPQELMETVVGKEDYDWETLKQNCIYEPEYHANHFNILMFWEVFNELSTEHKKAFLLFLTGCDRPPVLGMGCIKMTIRVLYNFTQEHFPMALTCHSLLSLPKYKTKEKLRVKFLEAINHNRGFWDE